jgi:hypothetical protein
LIETFFNLQPTGVPWDPEPRMAVLVRASSNLPETKAKTMGVLIQKYGS